MLEQTLDIQPDEAEEQNQHEQEDEQGNACDDEDPDLTLIDRILSEERGQHDGGVLGSKV